MLVAVLALGGTMAAQSPPTPPGLEERGLTSYVEFDGSHSADGNVFELDSSLGYKFNRYFAVDAGVPFYFLQASAGTTSSNGLGDPHVGLHLTLANPVVNYGAGLSASVPVADTSRGLSTGRVTFDWTNRFDRAFSFLKPFVEAGVANSIMDSRLYHRPYTTLGFNSHFRAGSEFDLGKYFSAGAAAWAVVPEGQQKVYSRLVSRGGPPVANPSGHGRVFENNAVTTGSADLARDNGFSGWLDMSPNSYLDFEVGYTRSVHYAMDTVSFSAGLNVGSLARHLGRH